MINKHFAFGPFIGDFETEIMEFMPFINWVKQIYNLDSYFVNTHYNTSFLYDKDIFILPVPQELTSNIKKQKKYKHVDINNKQYNELYKVFKRYIMSHKINKRDIISFNNFYNDKNIIYQGQKIHKKYNINSDFSSKYVFIADNKNKTKQIKIYKKLKEVYKDDIILITNIPDLLKEYNILDEVDIIDNGLIYMFNYVINAKMIFTQSHVWTYIANLYNKHLFTWTNDLSLFKLNGIYNFNNQNCYTIPTVDTNILINHIIKYIGE